MDLFDINNNSSSNIDDLDVKTKVLIWQQKVRRTINTYMIWKGVDKETLKGYHKTLKKAWGCNGSLKMNKVFGHVYDNSGIVDKSSGRNVKELVFHLSKDCLAELKEFLKEKEVNEADIEVKGV